MARKKATGVVESFEAFALEYLGNGFNATAAYRTVHPGVTQRTAEVEGSKLLRKPEVEKILDRERKARMKRLQMDGDEALEGLTRHARKDTNDLRKLFKNGKLLPIEQWPDDVADCVKAVKPTPFGISLVMYDKQRARTLLALNGGKIRPKKAGEMNFDHAAYLGAEPPPGDDE